MKRRRFDPSSEELSLYDYIEERNIFTDDPTNPTMSTAKALKRTKEHLGDTEAKVSIYVDPEKDKQKNREP